MNTSKMAGFLIFLCLLSRSSMADDQKKDVKGFNPYIWSSIMGTEALDALSTKYALDKNPNTHEANPLMGDGNLKTILPLKLGIGAAASYGLSKMMPNHPKLAKALAMGLAGSSGLIAAHNFDVANRAR
jgi:hypothetical protein